MLRLFLTLLLAVPSFAGGVYVVRQDTTATATKITVRYPASTRGNIRGIAAYIYCGATCEVVVERGGSTPTTTAATPTKVNETDDTPRSIGYTSSNVGSGTAIGPPVPLSAGGSTTLDLTELGLVADQHFTVSVSGSSGRQVVAVQYRER